MGRGRTFAHRSKGHSLRRGFKLLAASHGLLPPGLLPPRPRSFLRQQGPPAAALPLPAGCPPLGQAVFLGNWSLAAGSSVPALQRGGARSWPAQHHGLLGLPRLRHRRTGLPAGTTADTGSVSEEKGPWIPLARRKRRRLGLAASPVSPLREHCVLSCSYTVFAMM